MRECYIFEKQMKRIFLFLVCCFVPLALVAQNTRSAQGIVFDQNGVPMAEAKLTTVGFNSSALSGADGTFNITVSPYAKFIEVSKEGYLSVQVEIDGSYLIVRLKVDKKYAENKAKAEEEARKAAEAEKARLAEEAEAARLAAEAAEQARLEAEERKRIEEERRIAAEKAAAEKAEKERLAAEAKAKAEEEKRIAAEKAAAEKAEAAKRAAEEKARIAEEKRIAAEKAAAEKAEKARLAAEAKAKAEEEKRLAAEKAATERAEQARLVAEAKQKSQSVVNTQADAAQLEKLAQEQTKRDAELAQKQAVKAEREKRAAKWKEASLKGYRSYVDASWAIDSYSLMMSGGLHYIGGYQANNCIFFGVGTGINLAQTYEWNRKEEQLSPNSWNVPVYAYLRTNFINNRCSPFFALSAGYQFSTRRELLVAFDQPVKYKTSAIFVNPQLGVDFRINPKHSVYVAAGATLFQRPKIIEITPMTATFGSGLGWGIDLHLGFTF